MASIAQIAELLQRLNDQQIDALARSSGFIKRARRLSGRSFVQTLVWGWMGDPNSSLASLSQGSYEVGVGVSRQGLAQRFNAEAAQFLEQVLKWYMGQLVAGEARNIGLLARFRAVHILDSTVLELPSELSQVWAGCGGHQGSSAALKINVDWDIEHGHLAGLELSAGRQPDQRCGLAQQPTDADALYLADGGYFSIERLTRQQAAHSYWVMPLKAGTCLWDSQQRPFAWTTCLQHCSATWLEQVVYVGAKRLPCRLCAIRLSPEAAAYQRASRQRTAAKHGRPFSQNQQQLCEWLVYITNLPASFSLQDIVVLARLRWQIEKLFDIWKTDGALDKSRSHQPYRRLCETYAKLLALLIQHWCSLLAPSIAPVLSLRQAYRVVRLHTALLRACLLDMTALTQALALLQRALRACCMTARRKKPLASQLIANPSRFISLS